MERKKKVLFIINPISGGINKNKIPHLIESQVDKQIVDQETEFSNYPGHANEMAVAAAKENYDIVFAIGGDGTVNEVASGLVGTPTSLGVAPMGSGNGLARHMKLPLSIKKAINLVNNHQTTAIDACKMNDRYFFVTAGVGFDAHIGHLFATSKQRGLWGYVTNTIKEYFNYAPQEYEVLINGKTQAQQAFLVSFANAGQYGNNAYISPKADISDGKVDVCVMRPFNRIFGAFDLATRLFTKRMDTSEHLSIDQCEHVELKREKGGVVHLDGEPFTMAEKLLINVFPKSLNMLVANAA